MPKKKDKGLKATPHSDPDEWLKLFAAGFTISQADYLVELLAKISCLESRLENK